MDESFVTNVGGARDGLVSDLSAFKPGGGHLQAGGVSPLSFAYFSLRRQRKVGAAPHRGNANRPLRKQGKAKTARTTKSAAQAKKPHRSIPSRRSRPMTKPIKHSSSIIISPATGLSDSLSHILTRHGAPNSHPNSKNINHDQMQNPRNHRQL
jgi:hypothetical protein